MLTELTKRLRSSLLCALTATLIACQANMPEENADLETTPTINPDSARTTVTTRPLIQPIPETTLEDVKIVDLWDRIRAGFQLQAYYDHPEVYEQLQDYASNQTYFDLTIERARPFLYTIVEELEARELPLELALLPFVESAFDPTANSSEHAVGIWQFMGATAASFGLQHDWWYDARRDPRASTVAALDYLEILAQQFDQDWLLAIAAYNAGDGNVRRAIRRNNTDSNDSPFWDLALPRETRLHVPRVLALAKLVADIDDYAVALAPIDNSEPLTRVDVGAQIDLAQAAELATMEYTALRDLNPGYLQWATHPDNPQHILLPHSEAELLLQRLEDLDPQHLLSWDHYEIQPGDSLGRIANLFGTSVAVLQRVNNLRGTRIIAGRSLLIPRGPDADYVTASPYLVASNSSEPTVPDTYRIRSGDNLWSIARRFDLHSSDIASWNGIATDAILRPGQTLILSPVAAPAESDATDNVTTYIVRRGDSLASIASRFNTPLQELLEQNQLSASELIFPGQVILINRTQNRFN